MISRSQDDWKKRCWFRIGCYFLLYKSMNPLDLVAFQCKQKVFFISVTSLERFLWSCGLHNRRTSSHFSRQYIYSFCAFFAWAERMMRKATFSAYFTSDTAHWWWNLICDSSMKGVEFYVLSISAHCSPNFMPAQILIFMPVSSVYMLSWWTMSTVNLYIQ